MRPAASNSSGRYAASACRGKLRAECGIRCVKNPAGTRLRGSCYRGIKPPRVRCRCDQSSDFTVRTWRPRYMPRLQIDMVRAAQLAGILVLDIGRVPSARRRNGRNARASTAWSFSSEQPCYVLRSQVQESGEGGPPRSPVSSSRRIVEPEAGFHVCAHDASVPGRPPGAASREIGIRSRPYTG